MSEALLEFVEAFKKLCIAVWERMKVAIVKLARLVQVIRKKKPITRVRYDPVRKIVPSKPRLLDKRINMYHCRNNC